MTTFNKLIQSQPLKRWSLQSTNQQPFYLHTTMKNIITQIFRNKQVTKNDDQPVICDTINMLQSDVITDKICFQQQVEITPTITYKKSGHWIYPFIDTTQNRHAYVNAAINNKPCQILVDTGATRFTATRQFADEVLGKTSWRRGLRSANLPPTRDAQHKLVVILGVIQVKLELSDHLTVSCPLVIYEGDHSDCLLGYSILKDIKVGILPGIGLINYQEEEHYQVLQEITSFPVYNNIKVIVPPHATKIVEAHIVFPDSYTHQQKQQLVGHDVLVSSEDLESPDALDILTVPHIYDILTPDYQCHAMFDNSESSLPLTVEKHELIAMAEFPRLNSHSNDMINESFEDEIKHIQDAIEDLVTSQDYDQVKQQQQPHQFRQSSNLPTPNVQKSKCPEFNHCNNKNHHTHDANYEANLLKYGCNFQHAEDISVHTTKGEYQYITEDTVGR